MISSDEKQMIQLKNISKFYGSGSAAASKLLLEGASKDEFVRETGVLCALWDLSLDIRRGEIMAIIGHSGSGKSTLVRCINRLISVASGQVLIDGRDIGKYTSKQLLDLRRYMIAMVFQGYGLMNHRNIIENVCFGLEIRGEPKVERERRANEIISMIGLDGWQEKYCDELSGGMQQRVGIARALANSPQILLMDEPFSALDPIVRRELQLELLSIQRKLGTTIVFITHDVEEAFRLGDRVAILREGALIQLGTPANIRETPKDAYVQEFIKSTKGEQ
ncbi:MAG: ATP-binding cassette domain-containing protein [Oscillospiraceae bacterium]